MHTGGVENQIGTCLFASIAFVGRVSLWNPFALHFAGAGSLDRLQIVGVGRLHIWRRSWSDAWSLDRDKLTGKQLLRPQKLNTKA